MSLLSMIFCINIRNFSFITIRIYTIDFIFYLEKRIKVLSSYRRKNKKDVNFNCQKVQDHQENILRSIWINLSCYEYQYRAVTGSKVGKNWFKVSTVNIRGEDSKHNIKQLHNNWQRVAQYLFLRLIRRIQRYGYVTVGIKFTTITLEKWRYIFIKNNSDVILTNDQTTIVCSLEKLFA